MYCIHTYMYIRTDLKKTANTRSACVRVRDGFLQKGMKHAGLYVNVQVAGPRGLLYKTHTHQCLCRVCLQLLLLLLRLLSRKDIILFWTLLKGRCMVFCIMAICALNGFSMAYWILKFHTESTRERNSIPSLTRYLTSWNPKTESSFFKRTDSFNKIKI